VSPTEDSAIVLSVCRGEPSGVERMVSVHQDALYAYALRLMNDPDEASDVIQETFIRTYRALCGKHDETECRLFALRPYLFRIARNLAFNRHRAKRRMTAAYTAATEEMVRTNPTGDSEFSVSLSRALQKLSQSDRDLILLRFMEGMSYADMVEICGTTEAAVRGKVFRVLQKLKKLLVVADR